MKLSSFYSLVKLFCNFFKENDSLYDLQQQEWDPIIQWFCKRFNVLVEKSRDILNPTLHADSRSKLETHLMSYEFNPLYGILYATEALKSFILTMSTIEMFLDVRKAVLLSRLEQEFQLQSWSRIEWAHDLEHQDLQARLSAAVLFIYFNCNFHTEVVKQM